MTNTARACGNEPLDCYKDSERANCVSAITQKRREEVIDQKQHWPLCGRLRRGAGSRRSRANVGGATETKHVWEPRPGSPLV